jgi:hypothetical protein
MREQSQDRVRQLTELIRHQEYQVDPSGVADALLRHVRWEDVPDLAELTASVPRRRRRFQLRGVLRASRPARSTVRARPQLSH